MNFEGLSRRKFLRRGLVLAAGGPLALEVLPPSLLAAQLPAAAASGSPPSARSRAQVPLASCRSYGPEVREALAKCFDLLGGVGSLVKNKTVTVKLNLTGTDFAPFLGRPVGETF